MSDTNKKLVALTFDDGPSTLTPKVLDILEENGVVATFFLIGNLVTEDKKAIMERQPLQLLEFSVLRICTRNG